MSERKSNTPERVAKRARLEKWFWVCNYFLLAWLYYRAYGFDFDAKGVLILYLAIVSVHALVKTCATEEQAAESRKGDEE